MGQSVLAYQFVAGLISELKRKLVGREGSFEQLLTIAHFEEARLRDVVHLENTTRLTPVIPPHKRPQNATRPSFRAEARIPRTDKSCFSCGGTRHFARDCPQRGQGAPREVRERSTAPERKASTNYNCA